MTVSGFKERPGHFFRGPRPRRDRRVLAPRDPGDPATLPALFCRAAPGKGAAGKGNSRLRARGAAGRRSFTPGTARPGRRLHARTVRAPIRVASCGRPGPRKTAAGRSQRRQAAKVPTPKTGPPKSGARGLPTGRVDLASAHPVPAHGRPRASAHPVPAHGRPHARPVGSSFAGEVAKRLTRDSDVSLIQRSAPVNAVGPISNVLSLPLSRSASVCLSSLPLSLCLSLSVFVCLCLSVSVCPYLLHPPLFPPCLSVPP